MTENTNRIDQSKEKKVIIIAQKENNECKAGQIEKVPVTQNRN